MPCPRPPAEKLNGAKVTFASSLLPSLSSRVQLCFTEPDSTPEHFGHSSELFAGTWGSLNNSLFMFYFSWVIRLVRICRLPETGRIRV